jgi:hypothetical protein
MAERSQSFNARSDSRLRAAHKFTEALSLLVGGGGVISLSTFNKFDAHNAKVRPISD